MRVCVAGAGAIGSLFAAHLARVAEVSALVRREEHARGLRQQGLRVSGRGDFTARLEAATSPDALDVPDLVIVACKGTDLDAVGSQLARSLARRAPDDRAERHRSGRGRRPRTATGGSWRPSRS